MNNDKLTVLSHCPDCGRDLNNPYAPMAYLSGTPVYCATCEPDNFKADHSHYKHVKNYQSDIINDSLSNHAIDVSWRYAIPHKLISLHNNSHVIISQTVSGPFANNIIGGSDGQFYVSVSTYDRRNARWNHNLGSTRGGIHSFEEAKIIANTFWNDWRTRAE